MKKTKRALSVFLALILLLGAMTVSASSFAVSAAEDKGEEIGYIDTDDIVMYVGDSQTFRVTPTYNNINYMESGVKLSAWGVVSFEQLENDDVKLSAIGTGKSTVTIELASYQSNPNYYIMDTLTVTITVLAASQRPAKTASPTNVRIQNKDTGFYVTWDLMKNSNCYKVFYKTKDAKYWSKVKVATNSVILDYLNPGELYYFQIQSLDKNGAGGGYSKVSSMTHVRGTKLKSIAYNSNATVTLGWDAAGGANMYEVAKKKLGETKYSYFSVYGTTFNDGDVECGTIYYYQVRPYYTTGKSAAYAQWSNTKTITTLYRPTITSIHMSSAQMNINWNKIKGTTKYKVAFKRETDSAWNYRETTSNYYNVPKPTQNVAYYVQVCPMNGSIMGQWSLVSTATLTVLVKPALKAEFNNNSVDLSWNAVPGAGGYIIAKKMYGESDYTYITTSTNNYSDKDYVNSKYYYYQVRAYNAATGGPWSNVATVLTLGKTAVFNFAEQGDYLHADWFWMPGTVKYKVAYKTANEANWHYSIENNAYLNIYKPQSNTLYYLQVCLIGDGGVQGPWSKVYEKHTAAG